MAHTPRAGRRETARCLQSTRPILVSKRTSPKQALLALLISLAGGLGSLGCAAAEEETGGDDATESSEAALGRASADYHEAEFDDIHAGPKVILDDEDTVTEAVAVACSTTAVKGLATQLVKELQCMRPGLMASIADVDGVELGSAVFPYLQTSAAKALIAAQKARGVPISLNSGLRTLPQQYLLHRWYRLGRCGIGLAATPGTSNHESGIAIDISNNAAWRTALRNKKFRWLGAGDPVHFDYVGAGIVDISGLSTKAFQRLWNRNHPEDRIREDGDYGPATEKRLAKSPIGGFKIGPVCQSDL